VIDPAPKDGPASVTEPGPPLGAEGGGVPPGPASLIALFLAFNRLALQGFGGVLPIAHLELVERRRWVSPEEFVELVALGQVLPGPNIINVAVVLGDRWFGWRGALAASAGLLTVPLLIMLVLAVLYERFADLPLVAAALRGMGVVAAGIVISTAIKLSKTLRSNPLGIVWSLAFGAAMLVMVGFLRWPLVGALLGLAPAAVALAWSRLSTAGRRRPKAGREGRQ
jgi:chromate transporter